DRARGRGPRVAARRAVCPGARSDGERGGCRALCDGEAAPRHAGAVHRSIESKRRPSVTRVLFVNPGGALGGAEHTLLLPVRGLRVRGIDVTVALLGDGPLRERLNALGADTVRIRSAQHFRRAGRYRRLGAWHSVATAAGAFPIVFRLARLARRIRADLIHTNGTKAHLVGGLAGRISRVPV